MEYMSKNKDKSIVFTLDAKKAFVSVGYEYLYLTLQRFGFNSSCILLLKNLYHSPIARIKINGSFTNPVTPEKGG